MISISMVLLLSLAVLLGIALHGVRAARLRQTLLQSENQTLQLELERHRRAAHAILQELEKP